MIYRTEGCPEDEAGVLLREDELAWVSSAMSAVGQDLLAAGKHAAAQGPLSVSLEAAVMAAITADEADSDKQVISRPRNLIR